MRHVRLVLQVCASGALLNCIGPSLSPVFDHPRRRALRKVMMGGGGVMAAEGDGVVCNCV